VFDIRWQLPGKRLELLKEAVPKLARVAVLCDPTLPSNVREQKDIQTAALALGLTLRSWPARDLAGLEKTLAAMVKERPDALYVCQGGIFNNNRKLIADHALKARLPSIYSNIESVVAGGLMYYGTDRAESYRRVAWYVDKILKGTKPTDLPIEQPTKFDFVINLKAAKQIGVIIPPNVLARADRVIR
jgi:putative ABC transport system substrate-binding protein